MRKIKSMYITPWRYPLNWFGNIKEMFYYFKRCFQRGRYGVSYCDVWDLDSYLLKVFENGINIFKKDCSCPVYLTEEEWQNILTHMEELVKIIQIDGIDCEEANKYYNKDNKRWFEEVEKWDEYRTECLEEFCDLMKEWLFHLWW